MRRFRYLKLNFSLLQPETLFNDASLSKKKKKKKKKNTIIWQVSKQ